MTALEHAKQQLPLPDLMAKLGLAEHAKKTAKCPFHDDHSNSFSIFWRDNGEWAWNCFTGCGGGDEVDLLARVENISNSDACRRLIELAGGSISPTPRIQRSVPEQPAVAVPQPMPAAVRDAWREGVEYLQAHPAMVVRFAAFRGWPKEFAQYLVDCAAVSMPRYHNERGVAFQVVAPVGERGCMMTLPIGYHMRLKSSDGKSAWRFMPNEKEHGQSMAALPFVVGEFESARLLVITEGQWDCLTFGLAAGWIGDGCTMPEGVGLIGIRGASGVNTFLRHYERFWPRDAACLLLADADKAGSTWTSGNGCFAEKLAAFGSRVEAFDCAPHKDFNDLYRAAPPQPSDIADLLTQCGIALENEVAA